MTRIRKPRTDHDRELARGYRSRYRARLRIRQNQAHFNVLACVRRGGKRYRDKIRAEFIEAYSGRCSCCGEAEPRFLTLDHIGGGGKAHRKELRSQSRVLPDVKRQGWPKDKYRLLCMNCNMAVQSGPCPRERRSIAIGACTGTWNCA